MPNKFDDPAIRIEAFSDLFLVHCPRCDKCANVVERDKGGKLNVFSSRRIICSHCGYSQDWQGKSIVQGTNTDWYFKLPLWLQAECCGETFWAYNFEHLAFLEQFVGAGIRKAPSGSLAAKLPAWLKLAKNRDEILKTIKKIRGI
jgi:hypothetical protein